jgi:hypothetical protein
MQILARLVLGLAAADDELFLLHGHVELVEREAGNGKRDAQTFRIAVVASKTLDIVRRVSVGCLRDPIERTLDLVEAEKKRTG